MAEKLTVAQRARIAARYEVWQSEIAVHRWWHKETERHVTLDPQMMKNSTVNKTFSQLVQ